MAMSIPNGLDVAKWLQSLDSVTGASPVLVTIGRSEYPGAIYSTVDGEDRIYLLGSLPASYRRSTHTVYRFRHDGVVWFIGGYFDKDPEGQYKAFHPFGHWFGLHKDSLSVTHGHRIMQAEMRW
jgi:hypothetical protein